MKSNSSRYMTYFPSTTELVFYFSGYQEALSFVGQKKITIKVTDLQGASTTYTTALSIYKATERVEIKEEDER